MCYFLFLSVDVNILVKYRFCSKLGSCIFMFGGVCISRDISNIKVGLISGPERLVTEEKKSLAPKTVGTGWEL